MSWKGTSSGHMLLLTTIFPPFFSATFREGPFGVLCILDTPDTITRNQKHRYTHLANSIPLLLCRTFSQFQGVLLRLHNVLLSLVFPAAPEGLVISTLHRCWLSGLKVYRSGLPIWVVRRFLLNFFQQGQVFRVSYFRKTTYSFLLLLTHSRKSVRELEVFFLSVDHFKFPLLKL